MPLGLAQYLIHSIILLVVKVVVCSTLTTHSRTVTGDGDGGGLPLTRHSLTVRASNDNG